MLAFEGGKRVILRNRCAEGAVLSSPRLFWANQLLNLKNADLRFMLKESLLRSCRAHFLMS